MAEVIVVDAILTVTHSMVSAEGSQTESVLGLTGNIGADQFISTDLTADLQIPRLIVLAETEWKHCYGGVELPGLKVQGSFYREGLDGVLELPGLIADGVLDLGHSVTGTIVLSALKLEGRLSTLPELEGNVQIPPLIVNGAISLDFALPGFKTIVVNAIVGAVTEYERFGFNSYCFFNEKFCGANSDGIYLLGSPDDDTLKIDALAWFPPQDIGDSRARYAWLGLRTNGEVDVLVKVDESQEVQSRVYTPKPQMLHEARTKIAKGLRGRVYAFGLRNIDGADFDLDHLRILIEESKKER